MHSNKMNSIKGPNSLCPMERARTGMLFFHRFNIGRGNLISSFSEKEPLFGKIYYCTEGRDNKGFLHYQQSRCTPPRFCKHLRTILCSGFISWVMIFTIFLIQTQSQDLKLFSRYTVPESGSKNKTSPDLRGDLTIQNS
jgi:hypothetical protein